MFTLLVRNFKSICDGLAMRKPDFFIVGAQRSGTTAMMTYLGKHPEIFMVNDVEPHFFGTDLHRPTYIRDERSYQSLFNEAKDEKRVGEKSVGYLYSKRAAVEIKEYQPSAKIIIMLRNPVDVLYSRHSRRVYFGNEDIFDFEAALDAEEDRRQGLQLPKGVGLREAWRLLYRDRVKFVEQVQRYLDTFGRENVHIIIFDDFINDTASVYRDTLRFLDVNPDFQPEFQKLNIDRHVRSEGIHSFLKRPPKAVRSFVKTVTPFRLRQRVVNVLLSLNTKHEPRPPLPQKLRSQLQAEFLPEVEQLSKLLGRDLTHWCQT
jgi:hypothetical protein